jgi:hypothetical protein
MPSSLELPLSEPPLLVSPPLLPVLVSPPSLLEPSSVLGPAVVSADTVVSEPALPPSVSVAVSSPSVGLVDGPAPVLDPSLAVPSVPEVAVESSPHAQAPRITSQPRFRMRQVMGAS